MTVSVYVPAKVKKEEQQDGVAVNSSRTHFLGLAAGFVESVPTVPPPKLCVRPSTPSGRSFTWSCMAFIFFKSTPFGEHSPVEPPISGAHGPVDPAVATPPGTAGRVLGGSTSS